MADSPQVDEWADIRNPGMSNAEGVEFQDEWADVRTPGFQAKAVAVGKGAVGGFQQMGGLTTGAITGARMGAVAGPYGAAAGAVIGGGLGLLAGSKARELSVGDLEDLPESLRPYAVLGETTAGSIMPAAGITALGMKGFQTAGKSFAGRWLNRILTTAKDAPGRFMATESGLALGAGLGGATAEALDPGGTLSRMGGEFVGGMINPARLTHLAARGVMSTVSKLRSTWSSAARETAAGKVIADALDAAGEDPIALARILREADVLQVLHTPGAPSTPRTAAQRTGSQGLAALERRIGHLSPDFLAKSHNAAEENLEAVRRLIDYMVRTGDPDTLKAAAEMRANYFKTLVATRLKQAERVAGETAARISPESSEGMGALSKKAATLLEDALTDVRATETALWSEVPQDLPGDFAHLKSAVDRWKGELIPEQMHHVPDVVNGFLERVSDSGATIKDLKGIRSELLALARAASMDPARSMEAKIAGEMAEAVLDDMTDIPGVGDAYDAAREFSYQLNEVFTRSFVGKVRASTKYGARVPPEMMMRKALATGKELAEIQLRELDEAVQFMTKYAKDPDAILRSEEMVSDMMDVQERLIRVAAERFVPVDPKTGLPGKVNIRGLKTFINDNPGLMEKFPEVKADLEAALTSEVARIRITNVVKGRATLVQQKAAFAKLVKSEPIRVMEQTLRSTTMEKDLAAYIKVAKARGAGPDALSGLRASVLEAAMRKSTTRSGNFSLAEFKTFLFDPPKAGGKSVIDVLAEKKAIEEPTVALLKRVLSEADKIVQSQRPKMAIDEIEDAPGILYDLITRVVGAATAGKVAGATGSEAHGLIVAHGGSKAAREIVQKLPNMKIQAVLADLLANRPEVVADLIEKQRVPAAKLKAARLLNSYLFTSGVYGATDYMHQDEEPDLAP